MKIHRIAETTVNFNVVEASTKWEYSVSEPDVRDGDLLAEFAGRACYQSWNRPNPKTAKNADYIRSTVHEKAHESITAHASVTYYITGISRALTHEMIRSRFLAFSELSQRYVDMEAAEVIDPPAVKAMGDPKKVGNGLAGSVQIHGKIAKFAYTDLVDSLVRRGFSRKESREAARALLPSAMETRIVVTGNLRAWRDFLKQRWSVHADAEIRELAGLILADLRKVAPNTFADIPEKPYK